VQAILNNSGNLNQLEGNFINKIAIGVNGIMSIMERTAEPREKEKIRMEVEIENFGPISSGKINIRPFKFNLDIITSLGLEHDDKIFNLTSKL
jgi:hypothetical protein